MEKSLPSDVLFIGVDGGGTNTRCRLGVVGDDNVVCVVAASTGPASNVATLGVEVASQVIAQVVAEARSQISQKLPQQSKALCSIAGALADSNGSDLQSQLRSLGVADQVQVVSDLLPLVEHGRRHQRCGIGLIAGTGSAAATFDTRGVLQVVGGWGYLLGDAGSAYAMGRCAIAATLDRLECGASLDRLHQCIQNELSAQDVAQIKRAVYGHERPRGLVASLAKSVVELAAEGIESACVICDQAIDDLVELVARTNKLAGAACQNPLISATGGLLSSEAFRNRLSQQIERRLPGGAVVWIDDVAWLCVQQLAANCP